jgi:hypothetical protein
MIRADPYFLLLLFRCYLEAMKGMAFYQWSETASGPVPFLSPTIALLVSVRANTGL